MRVFSRQLIVASILLAAVLAVPAFAKDDEAKEKKGSELVVHAWDQRCVQPQAKDKSGETPKKSCAIFERVELKSPDSKTNMRLAEFVIGYAENQDKKKITIAKIVMPLGILLDEGVTVNIDGKKKLSLKPKYCTNEEGCVSLTEVSKDMLSDMSGGKSLTFLFKTPDGRDGKLDMSLNGFSKAFKSLE